MSTIVFSYNIFVHNHKFLSVMMISITHGRHPRAASKHYDSYKLNQSEPFQISKLNQASSKQQLICITIKQLINIMQTY